MSSKRTITQFNVQNKRLKASYVLNFIVFNPGYVTREILLDDLGKWDKKKILLINLNNQNNLKLVSMIGDTNVYLFPKFSEKAPLSATPFRGSGI